MGSRAQEPRYKLYDQLNFILRGGKTKRFHTADTLMPQTVAEHTFGVAMFCQLIDPGCRKEVILAALTHDLAEHQIGDVSSPTKRAYPELKAFMDRAENDWLNMFGLNYPEKLTEEEKRTLKYADIMDGMAFCIRERGFGNRSIQEVWDNFSGYLLKMNPQEQRVLDLQTVLINKWMEVRYE